jgi:NAD(P)-dependent dehydrogenase (short-subunit alcohol dehydrogenase family)
MTGRLDNEHILVTGGGRGIGSATVEKCLLEGANVSFIDLEGEEARSLLNKLNQDNKLLFVEGNVCSVEDLKRWCDASRKKFGAITGLVNNAGRNSYADPVTMTEQQWEDVFDVDLKAAWLTAREVLPDMIANKKGSIVNIASVHANMTYPSMFPYAALLDIRRLFSLKNSLRETIHPSGKKFWMSIQCTEWLNHQKLPIALPSCFRRKRPLLQERIGSLMVA